jgi:hypothetical protein
LAQVDHDAVSAERVVVPWINCEREAKSAQKINRQLEISLVLVLPLHLL